MNNKSVKSGFGIGCLIFAVAAIIVLPVRVFQAFTIIEGGTGFYSENHWTIGILYAVYALAVIAFLAFGIIKRRKLDFSMETVKRPGVSWLSLIAACGILLDAYNSFISFMSAGEAIPASDNSKIDSLNMIYAGEAVFAVLSAAYFVILWLTYLNGKSNGSKVRILALSPVIWSIFRLMVRFMRTISYIRVPELLFEMITIAFLILFFNAYAQANTGLGDKNAEWRIGAYGLPAALTALMCFIPRLILTLSGNSALLYSESTLQFCDFGIALFIIATVLTRVTDKLPDAPKSDNTPEE